MRTHGDSGPVDPAIRVTPDMAPGRAREHHPQPAAQVQRELILSCALQGMGPACVELGDAGGCFQNRSNATAASSHCPVQAGVRRASVSRRFSGAFGFRSGPAMSLDLKSIYPKGKSISASSIRLGIRFPRAAPLPQASQRGSSRAISQTCRGPQPMLERRNVNRLVDRPVGDNSSGRVTLEWANREHRFPGP